jgi:hypothetical protein
VAEKGGRGQGYWLEALGTIHVVDIRVGQQSRRGVTAGKYQARQILAGAWIAIVNREPAQHTTIQGIHVPEPFDSRANTECKPPERNHMITTPTTTATVENIDELRQVPLIEGAEFLVLGYYKPHDGGGGIFCCDPSSKENDNGGTIIAPTPPPPVGRWKRLYDGPSFINVKDFGALGDEVHDDRPAIQRALDTAATIATTPGSKKKGTIVFFPPGIYSIAGPVGVIIPRIPYGSLIIRGAGMFATQISAGASLPSDVPVVDFSDVLESPTGYEISDLLIDRSSMGTVLRHRSIQDAAGQRSRLTNSTLRNLKLQAPVELKVDDHIVESMYNTLEITGALSSTFDNLLVGGG